MIDDISLAPDVLDPIGALPDGGTIIIIDERNLVSECLAQCVQIKRPRNKIVHFNNVLDFVSLFPKNSHGAFILFSVQVTEEGQDSILEKLRLLIESSPETPVILIAECEDAAQILRSLDSGVRGYIPTSSSLSVALEAMNLVEVGGTFIPASSLTSSRKSIMDASDRRSFQVEGMFTTRQAAVVDALRQGKANKIIAYELNMRESTVKVHVRTIMKKLQAKNRTEVAYMTNARESL